MKNYTKDELQEILDNHKLWLTSEGESGRRADLSYADLIGADLGSVDLRNADLRSAKLNHADLSYADLRYAYLSYADLIGADLSFANLRSADLSYANLSYANLSNAYLRWAIGNMREVKSLQLDRYHITYTKDRLFIGCESHAIKEWINFSDNEIEEMNDGALKWWGKWKETIFNIIEKSPAK